MRRRSSGVAQLEEQDRKLDDLVLGDIKLLERGHGGGADGGDGGGDGGEGEGGEGVLEGKEVVVG